MKKLQPGSLLISEPFLQDDNFDRTVILLCSHGSEGSFGLVLNRKANLKLSDVLDFDHRHFDLQLGIGGPMEYNTLHYLHQMADLEDSIHLTENVYWGGDFETLKSRLETGVVSEESIRFFLGYSGWSPGQLEEELRKNVWFVNQTAANKLFNLNADSLWRSVLKEMGGKYRMYSNYPTDPSLN